MTATTPFSGKISAAKTALILIFLLVVWVGFVAMPSRKEIVKKIKPEESALATKLHAVGLPDNPDFDGLPEVFAIWAGKAEWKDDRAKFAYWHPVMKTYTYYLEAVRNKDGVRFREILEPHDPGYSWDESLPQDCPIRFYTSTPEAKTDGEPAVHPIVAPPAIDHGEAKVEVTAPKARTPSFEPGPIIVHSRH